MSDIDQLIHEHISRIERKFDIYSKNPAPTVPIYDLGLGHILIPSYVNIYMEFVGSPSDQLVCKLQTDNGSNKPSTTVVATSALFTITGIGNAHFSFTETDPPLIAANKYWIVVERTGSLSNTDYYQVGTNGAYPPTIGSGPTNDLDYLDGTGWHIDTGVFPTSFDYFGSLYEQWTSSQVGPTTLLDFGKTTVQKVAMAFVVVP